ncbi:hypothetical protein SAMN05421753_10427 [Planctomicrobium piriforme]|uniref:Uncharacterized protein n=2 Tax=Planctomicrobium piriforme TaxID=1576369 RepID=A0A1I3E081_9PLAN|nr:hypothetical protein SAMN05421753_10427 [Planctomicrobium piriforme]
MVALGEKLESLPALLRQLLKVAFGKKHSLEFGLIVDPEFSPDVYVEGWIIRKARLSRDHPGPRAMLIALERLAGGYQQEYQQLR